MRSAPLFRIGDYAIDLAAREIRVGSRSVDVEAKVFDLIALLLEHRDRALSKREINDALWGQRPVTDAALSPAAQEGAARTRRRRRIAARYPHRARSWSAMGGRGRRGQSRSTGKRIALRQLSASEYVKGDLDAAAGYLDEALQLLPEQGQPLLLAGLHSTYGAIEIKRGHLAQARWHLEQALPLMREAGSWRNESAVLVNLAIVDGEQGRISERIARFHAAIDAAREGGARNLEMRSLGGLAAAEYDAGRALDAVPMLQETLALAHELSDLNTTVHVATNLARVLAVFARYDSADALLQEAQAQRNDNKNWQAKVYWARGIVAEQRGSWHEALTALDAAHRLFARTRSSIDDAALLADSARVATRSGDTESTRLRRSCRRGGTARVGSLDWRSLFWDKAAHYVVESSSGHALAASRPMPGPVCHCPLKRARAGSPAIASERRHAPRSTRATR